MTIQEVLAMPEYSFIRENEHLGDKILFLTFGGSHAYGTNKEGSDIDVRGVCLNSTDELLGIKTYEQFMDAATDTTIYTLKKVIPLLCNCNPNTIEMLGCKPEHYAMVSPLGQLLLDNAHVFLSQRAFYSFTGYANSQLRRLQNAVARDRVTQSMREEHIRGSVQTMVNSLPDRYFNFDRSSVRLHVEDSSRPEMEKELLIDMAIKDYPARDMNGILNEIVNVIRDYDQIGHRNNKKDDAHLNKHAMHLIRLYLTGYDLIKNKKIVTYREEDHDLLMAIRSGYYMNEDGTYKKEFFDMVDSYEEMLKKAMAETTLPERPDYEKVNDLVVQIHKQALDTLA